MSGPIRGVIREGDQHQEPRRSLTPIALYALLVLVALGVTVNLLSDDGPTGRQGLAKLGV